jgi:hypothetical protein
MRTTVAFAVLGGYSWITAGVAPFTTSSYILVAIPCAVVVLAYVVMGGFATTRVDVGASYEEASLHVTLASVVPWIALLLVAVALELLGLALGGRSTSVPTLSTTVDHVLVRHWERALVCFAWLVVGALPLRRLRRSITRSP